MKTLIISLSAIAMLGCSSLQDAGHSEYSFRPFVDPTGNKICCEAVIRSGRELSNVSVHAVKKGDDYDISVSVSGVKAFAGQAIAAEVAGAVVSGAVAR